MAATLIVQSEDGEIAYPIEVPILRLGRAAQCDIRIDRDQVPDHLLTLEFRDQAYFIYNRADSEIHVGNKRVAPGGSHVFRPGQTLSIGNDLRIELEVDGDPTPAPAVHALASHTPDNFGSEESPSEPEQLDEAEDSETTAAASARLDPKTTFQLAVIGGCLVAMATIIAYKFTSPDKPRAIVLTLDQLMALAASDWDHRLVRQIQIAERIRLRGQRESARNRFFQIRDELERHSVTSTPASMDGESAATESKFAVKGKDFVRNRIWALKEN